MTSRAAVDAFLAEPALAVVGASRSGRKFGNAAVRALRRKGYRVYTMHRSADAIDGAPCYRRFEDLPEPVRAVVVVVPPVEAMDVVRKAAAAGVTRVWLQQGAESPAVIAAAAAAGLEPIAGECILMFAQPTGVHRLHRWIRGMRGRLPA